MIRQNPYYIQDNIRLDLRNSKGHYSTPSRAKYFYIYIDGELVYTGEFPRINIGVENKEEIVSEALNLIYFSEEVSESPVPEEIDEEDYEEEYYEEYEQEQYSQRELTDALYKDLLELFADEEPLLFEDLTGELPPLKGEIIDEYKDFETWSLGGDGKDGSASAQIFNFALDRPISLASRDPEIFIEIVKKNLMPALKQAYEDRVEGLDLFLLSFLYTQNVRNEEGQIEEKTKGIGIGRFQAKKWKDFEYFLEDLYEVIREKYVSYLERSVDNKITTIGFRLENLFETTSGKL